MRKYCIYLSFLAILAGNLPLHAQVVQGRYFEISKNLEIFANAFREVNGGYVDDLDPGQLMSRGLDAMLEGLDPYTNYISETDIEDYRLQIDAKYNGVGANGKKLGDWVVITEIYKDSPAQKAGFKVGDMIISIDGQNAKGKTEEEVMSFMRGFPGTKMNLTLRRPGLNGSTKDLNLSLERGDVKIPNVPHFGLVAENIGYINLSVFSEDAGSNVLNALSEMKTKNQALKGVILDLRGNGGGLLNEAVKIVNGFVPKGELVVSTKGKVPEWDNLFYAQHVPIDDQIPFVVLVDGHSASASEVVSGGLQDLDRAVIIGQKSFGKGLVQNTKDLGYNAKIKLTIAKYYTPSGRCIQAVRYKDGKPVDIPESERAPFKTRNGRVVLDGGGIKPDILMPYDTAYGVVKALLDQQIIFDFVTEYTLNAPTVDSIETYSFTDWSAFTDYVKRRNFDYKTASEIKLGELRSLAGREDYLSDADLSALENKIKTEKKGDIERNKDRIIREIEQEIVGRVYYQGGKVRKKLKNDPEIQEAIKVLNDPARYKSLLGKK